MGEIRTQNEEIFSDPDFSLPRKRRPFVAGVLTILVIGLGHVYNGEFSQGIVYYIGSLGISLLAAFLMLILPYPANFLVFFSLGFIYFFYVFWQGWKEAKIKDDHYQLKSYNKVYVYAALVFFSWYIINPLFSHVIKNNIVHAYRVVATSMSPTIFDGDHILVDELVYKFSCPHRGDVVVFKYPKNETQFFIKRVIGLPGETILIHQKECYINGKEVHEDYVVHGSHHGFDYPELDNFGPFKVPDNFFFVMGDNRDWSMDSRSFGPVQKDKIIGKAFMIYWSGSIDQQIFWDRVGSTIESFGYNLSGASP